MYIFVTRRRRSQTKLLFKNKFITIAGKTELYSYCVGSILINEPVSTLSIVYPMCNIG